MSHGPRAATCCYWPSAVTGIVWLVGKQRNERPLDREQVSESQLVESHLLPIRFRRDVPTSTKRHVFQKRVAGRATGYQHVGMGYESTK